MRIALLTFLTFFIVQPAFAQLGGSDSKPGDDCSSFSAGATRLNASAAQDGGEVLLICDGSVWQSGNTGSSGSGSGGTSMVSGWPDAISCNITGGSGSGNNTHFIAESEGRYRVIDAQYYYELSFASQSANATFNSTNTGWMSAVDCTGKSISQLYTDGQAFNFVGGGSGGGSGGSIFLQCTDENSDGDGTDDIQACIDATSYLNAKAIKCFNGPQSGDSLEFNSGKWQWRNHTGTFFDCTGGALVADLSAGSGGGGGSSSPAGADTQIQFNDGGALGADSDFAWNKSTNELNITGNINYSGILTDTSDARKKDQITPLEAGALSQVEAMKPVSFVMKDSPEAGIELGLIAQDIQKLYPELVKTADDEDKTLSLNYQGLIPVLIKAMQEMRAENNALKARVDALETE